MTRTQVNALQLSPAEQKTLLGLARASIESQLQRSGPRPSFKDFKITPHLAESSACFVTLEEDGELRGCIGSLVAHRPLAQDVWENAQAAAFSDPRFAPVSLGELKRISISISILTKPEPFPVKSEEDLLKKLRPGVDGLILTSGHRKATFLPSVWEELPEPREFVRHLKIKAGMARNEWPHDIEVESYQSFAIAEASPGDPANS